MKKLLLFILVITFGLYSVAQHRAMPPKEHRGQNQVKIKRTKGLDNPQSNLIPGENTKSLMAEEDVGHTWYDTQSNAGMQKRIYLHDDGTMGAVWTFGQQGNPNGDDRGTGYNYFDGDDWGPFPVASLEWVGARAGWPSYTTYGESGEAYVCHDYFLGTILGTRDERGMGDWTQVIQGGPAGALDISFPRIVTTGPNRSIIHILSSTWVPYNGQEVALLYARTSDAGTTWEIENQTFPEFGPDYTLEIGFDSYSWAEPKDGLMAFVVGDLWADLVLMKSTDDGETWEDYVVWDHPYPLLVGTAPEQFYGPDGSHDIAIDNNGLVHIVFSVSAGSEPGSFSPEVDGVVYWNEDRVPFSNDINALNPYGEPGTELEEDYSLIGWSQDLNNNDTIEINWEGLGEHAYNTGLSSQPQIVVDDMNQIFVIYSSVTEGYDNGSYNFRHLWARSSTNNGEWWGSFLHLTSDPLSIIFENVYASAAVSSDENIHFIYQRDNTPGNSTNGASVDENFIRYMSVSKEDIISGVTDHKKGSSIETVSQNYPNPFSSTSTVYVMLEESAKLGLNVHNLMGQLVYAIPEKKYNSGKVEFTIDGSKLESGIYFYSIVSGTSSVTKKMIIE